MEGSKEGTGLLLSLVLGPRAGLGVGLDLGPDLGLGLGLGLDLDLIIGVGLGLGLSNKNIRRDQTISQRGDCMKKLVEQVEGEGLESLLGEHVVIWCLNYIYSGKLIGVNSQDVLLEEASVVYETGPLQDKQFKDAQPLPGPWYIRTATIESYGKRGF